MLDGNQVFNSSPQLRSQNLALNTAVHQEVVQPKPPARYTHNMSSYDDIVTLSRLMLSFGHCCHNTH